MKLTITNVHVTKTGTHSDYALSCEVPAHGARYHIWLDGRTRRIRDGVGLDRAEIHKNPIVNKGEQGYFEHRTCRVDSNFGRTLIEMMMNYAKSNKLFDKADTELIEKAIIIQRDNAEHRKIARMKDHAEQMYELLKEMFGQMTEQYVPTNADMGDYASDYRALESLLNEIDNDPAQTSNERVCTCGDIYAGFPKGEPLPNQLDSTCPVHGNKQ